MTATWKVLMLPTRTKAKNAVDQTLSFWSSVQYFSAAFHFKAKTNKVELVQQSPNYQTFKLQQTKQTKQTSSLGPSNLITLVTSIVVMDYRKSQKDSGLLAPTRSAIKYYLQLHHMA